MGEPGKPDKGMEGFDFFSAAFIASAAWAAGICILLAYMNFADRIPGALLLSCIVAIPVSILVRRWLHLPPGFKKALPAMLAYTVPLQVTALLAVVRLPFGGGAWVLLLSVLTCLCFMCGLSLYLRHLSLLRTWERVLMGFSLLVGAMVGMGLQPGAVAFEGLLNYAGIPSYEDRTVHPVSSDPPGADVIHISDLHFTASAGELTRERNPPGNALVGAYWTKIREKPPRLLLVTGDITDGGDEGQWAEAKRSLKALSGDSTVILCPGNHDLTTAYSRAEEREWNSLATRRLDFLEAQRDLCPDILLDSGRTLGSFLDSSQPTPEEIDSCKSILISSETWRLYDVHPEVGQNQRGFGRGMQAAEEWKRAQERARRVVTDDRVRRVLASRRVDEAWHEIVPLRWRSRDGSDLVLVLDSFVSQDESLGSSAIGSFGEDQLERLDKRVREEAKVGGLRRIFMLSHHPIASQEGLLGRLDRMFEFAVLRTPTNEATRAMEIIRGWAEVQQAPPIPVEPYFLCGHRHQRHHGKLDGLWIVEAPSVFQVERPEKHEFRGFWSIGPAGSTHPVRWQSLK